MKMGSRYNLGIMCFGLFHFRLLRRSLIGLVASVSGCAANRGPISTPADLSGPEPAALSFLYAIANGDMRAARAMSTGTDQDKQWITATVSLITGLRAYDRALLSRFGDAAVSTDNDLKQAVQSLADEPIMRLEGGIVKESDETAEVDPALNGARLAARPPIYLRREKGVWKVDLAAMKSDPDHDPTVMEQYLAAGKALQHMAYAVRRGQYKTLGEALSASTP
jgi:hypothetical protein